jgi:hypothetical protein
MLASIGSATIALFLSLFKYPKDNKKFAPCTTTEPVPSSTPFILPKFDNSCPIVVPKYDLLFFNPVNDPLSNNNLTFTGPNDAQQYFTPSSRSTIAPTNPNVPSFMCTINGTQYTQFSTMNATASSQFGPVGLPDNINIYANVGNTIINPEPLNMCPQAFVLNAVKATSSASQFVSAVPLPASSNLDPMLWVIPGLPEMPVSGNGINVPSLTSIPTTSSNTTTYSTGAGLASTLYIVIKKATSLFIELGGANGGDVPIYTSGIDPVTKLPRSAPGYIGGFPGYVYGLYNVNANDVLKVFLGSKGDELTNTTGLTTFDGNGQGGLGTVFGGSNGGGPSYIVHYKSSVFGLSGEAAGPFSLTLEAALNSDSRYTLVCVAGGGGGASRNASGGSAGFSNGYGDPAFSYGLDNGTILNDKRSVVSNPGGSTGGSSFLTGPAPYNPNINANGLSGGGGKFRGGVSKVPNQIPNDNSSWGHVLLPFVDTGINGCHGGGSVSTDLGSGGGGGGGGLFGGGAGGWNSISKPNNVHGAGGGGSSSFGLLKPATNGLNATLNAYRNTNSGSIKWTSNGYGYLVLGCSLVPE